MKVLDPKKSEKNVARILEDILGCKWSLQILAVIRKGVCRPGALTRSVGGLSTKVLNERLNKMVRFGILVKHSFAEIPPRVEYNLTDFGLRIATILDEIEALQEDIDLD